MRMKALSLLSLEQGSRYGQQPLASQCLYEKYRRTSAQTRNSSQRIGSGTKRSCCAMVAASCVHCCRRSLHVPPPGIIVPLLALLMRLRAISRRRRQGSGLRPGARVALTAAMRYTPPIRSPGGRYRDRMTERTAGERAGEGNDGRGWAAGTKRRSVGSGRADACRTSGSVRTRGTAEGRARPPRRGTGASRRRWRDAELAPAVDEPPRRRAVDEPPAPLRLTLPAADVRPPRPAATARRGTGFRAAGLFLAGLGLGAAAVALVVVPALREPAPAPGDPPAVQASPASLADATGTLGNAPTAPPFGGSIKSPRPVGLLQPAAEAEPPRGGALTGSLLAALPGPTSVETVPVPAPAPVEPTAPDPEPEPEPQSAAEATAVPALPLPARVFIHYPASAEAAADRRPRGAARRRRRRCRDRPGPLRHRPQQRALLPRCDGAGAATSPACSPRACRRGAPQARDFTDYATPPRAGKGRGLARRHPGRRARAPRRRRRPPHRGAAPPAAPAPVARDAAIPPTSLPGPTPPADQAEAVERILVERAVERLCAAAAP